MNFRALPLLALLFLLAACETTAPQAPAPQATAPGPLTIADLLPEGTVNADILAVRIPPRAEELAEKMRNAFREKPEWLADYIKRNAQPGKPLPYHPNFGVTKDEYDELLQLSKKPRIVTIDTKPVSFDKQDNAFTISSNGAFPFLDGTVIDTRQMSVTTRYGVLRSAQWQTSKGLDSAIGEWRGYNWHIERLGMGTDGARSIHLELYRLASGETYIDFKAVIVANDQAAAKEVILKFDRSKASVQR